MKHGGDPPFTDEGNRAEWLDLSTGINPHSYPIPELEPVDWEALPTRNNAKALLVSARRYYGVPDFLSLIATPGTETAINQLPCFLSGSVGIVEPTYSSHRVAWETVGRSVNILGGIPQDLVGSHVLVVNPNNPTGELLDPEMLLSFAQSLAPDRFLIVDEAFMDCTPDRSVVPHIEPDLPIIVFKSFGKFFGLAGLRLGFVIGRQKVLQKLSSRFGDWCVSGPALKIGTAALSDESWQSAMRLRLSTDMDDLEQIIPDHGSVIGKTDLFLTYKHPEAHTLHRFLAEQKIWTRCFSYEPSWLRLGLPKTQANRQRLSDALKAFENQNQRR